MWFHSPGFMCGENYGRRSQCLTIHKGGEWEIVEEVGEVLPHVGVAVLAQTLVIEPIHLGTVHNYSMTPYQKMTYSTVLHKVPQPN